MPNVFTESQNSAIVKTQLDSVFFQVWDAEEIPGRATCRTDSLFRQENFDKAVYSEQIFSGVPTFSVIGETQVVPQFSPKVTNTFTTNILDFGQELPVSKDMYDDVMHGVWPKSVADFAEKARIAQDINAFALFNNGSTTYLSADGVSLFNAAHPLIGGGTQSNLNTGGGSALSNANLNTAIVQLATMKDQSGTIIGAMPKVLLVPPALFQLAIQLTQSVLVGDASTNAVNVWRGMYGLEVYQTPYISAVAGGSDTRWFILGRNHSVTRLIRQGMTTEMVDWKYSNNRVYRYVANFREAVKASDYSSIIANAGV
jgi:hypothetical protein